MSSIYSGAVLRLSVFGQSHAEAVGMTLEGLPAGLPVDLDALQGFLNRRAPGRNNWSTPRKEEDRPEFLCGLKDGKTCGAPLTAIIRNRNTRSGDYEQLRQIPRPGHADYAARLRYGDAWDGAGGGQFSGRMTAPICIAGGVLLQMLEAKGIRADARIRSVAGIEDASPFTESVARKEFPTVSDEAGEAMKAVIAAARADGDSVGGVIECVITGVPGGLGGPMFDGVENRISQLAFAIPAVKGVEFGSGFQAAEMRGSQNNDAFAVEDGRIVTETNHAGGILGGITTGMPVVFRVAVKPTPSIAQPQKSVNLETLQPETLCITGRHDPCIVPRAVPVVEAIAALAIADLVLEG